MTAQRAALTAWAEAHDTDLIFLDPPAHFDHAILGVVFGFGQDPAVLYDEAQVIAAMVEGGMTDEDAEDTIGAYLGPATPRFLTRVDERDA